MAARKMKIEFGLMNLACRRESAVQAEVDLKNLCLGQEGKDAHPASTLKQDPSYCPKCGTVDKDRIVKGHGSGETWTILTDEQVTALEENKQEFSEHVSFKLVAHPAAEFLTATAPGGSVYYVTPEEADADHYALLAQLISAHPELAFAGLLSLSTGGKAKLFALHVRGSALVMTERVREQALKTAPVIEGEVNEKLLAMMEGALSSFVEPYEATDYEDRYNTALLKAVEAGVTTEGATSVAKVSDDDLMAKLAALGKD